MAGIDPNDEWLGYVQPVGLVVAPVVLARYGLTPAIQTKGDTDAVREFVSPKPDDGKAKGADPAPSETPGPSLPARSVGGRPRSPARPAGRRCRKTSSSRSRKATPRSGRTGRSATPTAAGKFWRASSRRA